MTISRDSTIHCHVTDFLIIAGSSVKRLSDFYIQKSTQIADGYRTRRSRAGKHHWSNDTFRWSIFEPQLGWLQRLDLIRKDYARRQRH